LNLHLTYDNQFIDFIIKASHELGRNDRFIIYTNEFKPKLDHVKHDVPFAQFDSDEFKILIGDIRQYKNIYIHWLEGRIVEFVNQLPKDINVIWCFWGGDGLEFDALLPWVYQAKSFSYFKKEEKFKISQWRNLRTWMYRKKMKKRKTAEHIQAIKRINWFAHYLPDDFHKIVHVTGMSATFIPFHYAALEDLADISTSVKVQGGHNILLGNSDTLTNNHFEAIDLLSKLELQGRKIYCPLSYEKGRYANIVAKYGKAQLGDQFIPMLDFMPRDEYNKVLGGISVAIMNHNRSQALGNIVSLLWNGTKVFMSKDSTLFSFLKGEGMRVFSIQDELIPGHENALNPLEESDILENRKVLQSCFGHEAQLQKIKKMLEL
jgi:dTDP-N-acetylfucosamine:lipid II N-acetylfucosaminyltransferase